MAKADAGHPTMNRTAKKKCKCQHTQQDKMYGPGMRVHNGYAKGWRCTVCGEEKYT